MDNIILLDTEDGMLSISNLATDMKYTLSALPCHGSFTICYELTKEDLDELIDKLTDLRNGDL